MGYVKRLLEEQQTHGFRTDRHLDRVCGGCIADEALARFVNSVREIDECDFCAQGPAHGMQLGELFKYMSGCIAAEWDDPLNQVGWDSGWDPGVVIHDSDDLLEILAEPLLHDGLREAFVDAFEHEWCQRNPYSLPYWDVLRLSWERFAELVRSRHRYLFLRRGGGADDELVPPAEMLESIAQAIHNTPWRMLRRVPAGTSLIRARAHDANQYLDSPDELGSPPHSRTRPNRMSPAGISMFYASEDPANAIAEVLRTEGEAVTYAEWVTARDLWCLDLTRATPVPSLFDLLARRSRPWLRFLVHFASDLSKPAKPGVADIDYAPTQVVTEYVRDVLRVTTTAEPIEAVSYTSALDNTKRCWVVFADPTQCGAVGDASDQHLLLLLPETVERRVVA